MSPVSYGPSAIPAIVLNGTFSTTLSISIGPQFVTAAFNGTRSGATISVQFNNTLPSTVQGSLSGFSRPQYWNSSSLGVGESNTFSQWSAVNQTYSVALASLSRAGTSSPPGSPSFSGGSPGVSSPEQATAVCQFTLTTAVPTVSNASDGPYRSLNATTANVTWNSTADALGFFTYYEVGSPINWTISGITPVHGSGNTWVYSIEVHGLVPYVAYNGTFGVSVNHGCLVEEDQVVTLPFKTSSDPGFETDPTLPYIWEHDQPYDSISQTGGGIVVQLEHPK